MTYFFIMSLKYYMQYCDVLWTFKSITTQRILAQICSSYTQT